MSQHLSRQMAKSLAAGRAPKKELEAARRHLAECARCRAAVVAAARGVQGPGDTVLLKRSDGSVPRPIKVAAVLVSVLAVGIAWRFGASPKPEAPRPETRAQASLEPAPTSSRAEPPSAAPPPVSSSASAAVSPVPSAAMPAAAPVSDEWGGSPTVRVVKVVATDDPAPATAIIPAPAAKRPPAARSTSRSASSRSPSPPPRAVPPRPAPPRQTREYDFGIDEPEPR